MYLNSIYICIEHFIRVLTTPKETEAHEDPCLHKGRLKKHHHGYTTIYISLDRSIRYFAEWFY